MILGFKKVKSVTASTFPLIFALKWWDWMSWSWFYECWVLSQLFHSPLLPSSRLFSSSSLSAFRMVWSAHLMLLIFFLSILIPACEISSSAPRDTRKYFPFYLSLRPISPRSSTRAVENGDILFSQRNPYLPPSSPELTPPRWYSVRLTVPTRQSQTYLTLDGVLPILSVLVAF